MARTGYIQWNNDDVHFVLDQQAGSLSLWNNSPRVDMSLRHIIMILGQPVFTLTP
jgi:hypothetical protein